MHWYVDKFKKKAATQTNNVTPDQIQANQTQLQTINTITDRLNNELNTLVPNINDGTVLSQYNLYKNQLTTFLKTLNDTIASQAAAAASQANQTTQNQPSQIGIPGALPATGQP